MNCSQVFRSVSRNGFDQVVGLARPSLLLSHTFQIPVLMLGLGALSDPQLAAGSTGAASAETGADAPQIHFPSPLEHFCVLKDTWAQMW